MHKFAVKLEAAFHRSELKTFRDVLLSPPVKDYEDLGNDMLKCKRSKASGMHYLSTVVSVIRSKFPHQEDQEMLNFSYKPSSPLATLLLVTSAKLLLVIQPQQVDNFGFKKHLSLGCLMQIMLDLIHLWYLKKPHDKYYHSTGLAVLKLQNHVPEVMKPQLLLPILELEHLLTGQDTKPMMDRLNNNILKLQAEFHLDKRGGLVHGVHKSLFLGQLPQVSSSSTKEAWEHLLVVFRIGASIGQHCDSSQARMSALKDRLEQLLYKQNPLNLSHLIAGLQTTHKLQELLPGLLPIVDWIETLIKKEGSDEDKTMYLIRLLTELLKCVVWLTSCTVKSGTEPRKLGFSPSYTFRRILGILLRETGVQTPYPETMACHNLLDEERQTTVIRLIVEALIYPLEPASMSSLQIEEQKLGLLYLISDASVDGLMALLHSRLIARLTGVSFWKRPPMDILSEVAGSPMSDQEQEATREKVRSTQFQNERVLLEICDWFLEFRKDQDKNKVYQFLGLDLLRPKAGGLLNARALGTNLKVEELVDKIKLVQTVLARQMMQFSLEILYCVCQELLLILRDFTMHKAWETHQFSKLGSEVRIQEPSLFTELAILDVPLKELRFFLDASFVPPGSFTRSCQMTIQALQGVMYELVPPGYFCTQAKSPEWEEYGWPVLDHLGCIRLTFTESVLDTLAATNFQQASALVCNLSRPEGKPRSVVQIDPRLKPMQGFKEVFVSSLKLQLQTELNESQDESSLSSEEISIPGVYIQGVGSLTVCVTDLVDMLFLDIKVYSRVAPLLYQYPIGQFLQNQGNKSENGNQTGKSLFTKGLLPTKYEKASRFITWFDSLFGNLHMKFDLLDESIYVGLSETEGSKLKHLDPDAKEENRKRGSCSIEIMHAQIAVRGYVSCCLLQTNEELGKEPNDPKKRLDVLDYLIWGQPYFLTVVSLPGPGRDFVFRNFFTNFLKTAIVSDELKDNFHPEYSALVSQILPELDISWIHPFTLKEYGKTIQGAQHVPSVMSQIIDCRKPEYRREEWMHLMLKPSQIIQALHTVLADKDLNSLARELQLFISDLSVPNNFATCHGLHLGSRLPLFVYMDACFVRIVELFLQSVQLLQETRTETLDSLAMISSLAHIVNLPESSPHSTLATQLLKNTLQIQNLTRKLITLDSHLEPAVLMSIITLLTKLVGYLPGLDYFVLEACIDLFNIYVKHHEFSDPEQLQGLLFLKKLRTDIETASLPAGRADPEDSRIRLLDRYLIEAQLAQGDMTALDKIYEHWKWWSYSEGRQEFNAPNEGHPTHLLGKLKFAVSTEFLGEEDPAREHLSPKRLWQARPEYVDNSSGQQSDTKAQQLVERDQFYKWEILRLLTYALTNNYGPFASAQWFVHVTNITDSSKISYECGYRMVKDLNRRFQEDISAGILTPAFECFYICALTRLLCMGTKYTR